MAPLPEAIGLQLVSPRVEEKKRKNSQGSYCKSLSSLPVLPAPVFFKQNLLITSCSSTGFVDKSVEIVLRMSCRIFSDAPLRVMSKK
jgi:hypothetical protein